MNNSGSIKVLFHVKDHNLNYHAKPTLSYYEMLSSRQESLLA